MKKKLLLTSILSVIMCMSLIVGATFALFTSEDSVSITATSGKVSIQAEIVDTQYKTLTQDWTDFTGTTTLDNLGGSVVIDNTSGSIAFNNVVPGDGIKFNVNILNGSNVTVKYRTVITTVAGSSTVLFDALKIDVNGQKFYGQTATKWTALNPEINGEKVSVSIELPKEVGGDELMSQTCKFNVFVEAVQGNESTIDDVFVREENVETNANSQTTQEINLGVNESASASVPAGTKLTSNSLTFMVQEVEDAQTGNFPFDNGEDIIPLEISIPEVANSNDAVITVTLKDVLPRGLDNVILFHEGVQMTSVRFAKPEYAADEFFYDKATGYVTIATTHFSNFTIVVGGEDNGFPVADIEVLDESLFPTEDYIWNLEGMMSFPDIREDIALEKAFTFIATQTAEEVELSPYKNWLCDFVISCDQDVALGELGLSGQYGFADIAKQTTWYTFGNPIELEKGVKLPMLTSFGLPQTYEMICRDVQAFSCGIFRGQNNKSMAGKTITVSLCIADIETVSSKLDREPTMEDFSEEDGTLITIASIDYTFEVLPEGIVNSAFTSETGFWGDWGGNPSESFEIKFYDGNEFLGSTSLNNVDGIIDGDVYVTWNLPLTADLGVSVSDCGYWTYNWVKKPTLVEDGENGLVLNPITAVLYIDGTEVGSTVVVLNGPDGINKIVACVVNENNEIVKFLTKLSFEDLVNPYIVLLSDVNLNDSLVIG